ncbi:ABC transporter ATP-binding protein [Aureimonas flava]|uniref:ABC transporter ATP-binding protein n=1 Tax=Aureimonas flava TaxID=2320271 RepID=A0A3A1WK95_9HYPH|nr:ABC transporter ATP-binding protein [Aureimonas flava]RIY00320.1 ABC transporter ATP-binding protein [Aureimonas flava]
MPDASRRILEIRDLKTYFGRGANEVRSVDGVSLHVDAGETLGVVGESGCGKSVTSLSVMRLVPSPGRYAHGEILFEGRDILGLGAAEMRRLRGDRLSMIFQEPMTSLNPVRTVGDQIAEAFRLHRGLSRKEAAARAVDMLRQVGIPAPERRADEFPHQLSGGMRQRVMIAIALSCHPRLLIADEPTTALDVTIQAQILDLLRKLKAELGMAIMLITHDLGVVAEMCDRVVVMYAGRVVEEARVTDLFDAPAHPYTEGLLASIPKLDEAVDELFAIEGQVPSPTERPPGCPFEPRCRYAFDRCRRETPELRELDGGRRAACFLAADRLARPGAFS